MHVCIGVCLSIHLLVFKLLPPLVYCEQDYCEHLGGLMACSPVFNSMGYIPLHRVARSQGNLLNSSRSC